ncbi:MAG: hypothetical protein COU33_01440 [Candidatus Magasanikbacteria bacterium CG10_big_fil_rev_8_21_14_0_10_43_6]|uniref:Thioredoxin domain-containing protein n=1 Tax=Candidatus Magasanikbacteria bacterium CG10_big_fil_rev_8_21_14_0_10_43_6 TaxID=1974650 RepID=A0A2M6W1Q5_9BACT|nr:MAG: hypothetical protein COU33_01440 [Candidatus Magasanikbacteria bacterium CG10_big_fil_rev_8_21_14_0_10_43_6]
MTHRSQVLTPIISVFALLLLVGAGCTLPRYEESTNIPETDSTDQRDAMETNDAMMKNGDATETNDAMMKDSDTMEKESGTVSATGSYEAYSADKLANAHTGDVVLFFHAGWCPTCKTLNSALEASRANIPAGLTILKTDYDTQTELKKKYGVTYQHTLVQVDANGNMLKKWNGGSTLESITVQVL